VLCIIPLPKGLFFCYNSSHMNFIQFLRIVEIRTKIVSVSTLALGFLWTWVTRGTIEWPLAVLMILATLMVDMGTTAFNTFYDFTNGVDAKETNREADKVLVHQNVAPGWALVVSLGLYGGAGILGLIITFLTGPWVLLVGILSFAVGFFYNGGPRPLSSTPLGEIFAGGFLGGVLFLLVIYTQTGALNLQDFLMAVPSTFFIASILTVNNTCDAVGDKRAGRFTLSILLGPKLSSLLIPLEGIVAYLSGATALALMAPATSGLQDILLSQSPLILAAGFSVPGYLAMQNRGYSHETKGPNMGEISQLFLIFTLGMVGALITQGILF